jgi:3-deoxy-D-manno-octulosonic-acid transferase
MWLWLAVTAALPFAWHAIVRRLHTRQGAAPDGVAERWGQATQARPPGRLIWLHASSVGEVASVARLARALTDRAGTTLLVTTVTATGAATAARLVPGVGHQFLPMDSPPPCAGFWTTGTPMRCSLPRAIFGPG